MKLRHLHTWKFAFYGVTLPLIRRLGPRLADGILSAIGRVLAQLSPNRRVAIAERLSEARRSIGTDWDDVVTARAVAANIPRYLARDYPLDLNDNRRALGRFNVAGESHLRSALAEGRGVVLVGSHLGAHVAGLHWLLRGDLPVRVLVQRPNHVSNALNLRFDRGGPHPQAKFFLHRGLTTPEAADRLLRARAALRDGLAVYLNGDIPWTGRNARPGRLLGQTRPFLATWADLAVLARCPVVFVTCTHALAGRYALDFSAPITIAPGDEPAAVATYFARLEASIAAHPADAVAHLTWPCFGPGVPEMPCERARLRKS